MKARLRGLHSSLADKRFEIPDGEFRIGRGEDCPIRIDNEFVSRYHCILVHDDYSLRIRDLGSKNGTFVNGCRLGANEVLLHHGDLLMVGDVTFQVEVHSERVEDPAGAPPPFVPYFSQQEAMQGTGVFDDDTINTKNPLADSSPTANLENGVPPAPPSQVDAAASSQPPSKD